MRKKLPPVELRVSAEVVVTKVSVNEPAGVLVIVREALPAVFTVPLNVVVQRVAAWAEPANAAALTRIRRVYIFTEGNFMEFKKGENLARCLGKRCGSRAGRQTQ